jgi:hypothetical protein
LKESPFKILASTVRETIEEARREYEEERERNMKKREEK